MIKKILTSFLAFSFVFLINIGYAYSLEVRVDGQSITLQKNEGEQISLASMRNDWKGWNVLQGGVIIEDDGTFIMPAQDVIIEAIIPTEYSLITSVQYIVIESGQKVGTEVSVTVSGLTEAIDWLVKGRSIYSISAQKFDFVMPYNDVKINAYE